MFYSIPVSPLLILLCSYCVFLFLLYCTLLYIVIYFLQLTLHFKDPRPNTGSCTHFKTFLFFKTLYESAARICCFILWILTADFKSSSIKSSKYLLSIPQFCFSKELFDIWGNILVPFRRELEIIKRISPDVQLLKKCVLEPQNELSLALFPVILLSETLSLSAIYLLWSLSICQKKLSSQKWKKKYLFL